jgi:hypothetical protein
VSVVSAVEWSTEEMGHEALFPLALRLPPVERGLERPVFRRVRSHYVLGQEREPWERGYVVEQSGHPLLLLEGYSIGIPGYRFWKLKTPRWSPVVLRVPWDIDRLLDDALRALLLAEIVDSKGGPIVADKREWKSAGEVDALPRSGWRTHPWTEALYSAPSYTRLSCIHRDIVRALWRHVGTATLEDALLTLEVTRRLAEQWEADRHPRLRRALRNSWIDWKWKWKRWIDRKLGPWRARRLERRLERQRRWLERDLGPEAARKFLGEMS